MARPRKLIPSYRKHKASGQAFGELNGRRFYLGTHDTKASKLEYDRLITEWLASGRFSTFGIPTHTTSVVEIAVDYMRYAKGYYGTGSNSELDQIIRIVRTLKELYGRTPAEEFGPLQFKAVRERFLSQGGSRSYINANMRRITRMFRWAAGEGRIPPAVPQALAMVPGLRRGRPPPEKPTPCCQFTIWTWPRH